MIKIFNMYREMRKWRRRAVDAEDLIKYWEKVVRDLQAEIKEMKNKT